MLARAILAYVLSLPFFLTLAAGVGTPERFMFQVTLASSAPGLVQVFYDTGQGFSGAQSSAADVVPSGEPREYALTLPGGRYRQFRLDPGTAPGRYVIYRVAIISSAGTTLSILPLADLQPVHQLTAIERSATRLVLQSTPDATDPQILYVPEAPLVVATGGRTAAVIAQCAAVFGLALALLLVVEAVLAGIWGGWGRVGRWLVALAAAHPVRAVVASGVVATIVAMYPVLLLGRSLVSPNNGPKGMLYDSLPLTPQSTDLVIEDNRGSDTAAAMYAFVPYSHVQRQALREGEWPLWNRYNAAGRPLWGQGQTFLLDPLHWLTLVTSDPSLGWDLKFVAHRLVFAVGIGLAALAATGSWPSAAIAAGAAPFVGVYAYRVSHPATFALTYAPWVLLGWFRLAGAQRARERMRSLLFLVGANSLVLLASPPKEAAIMLGALSATGMAALAFSQGPWPVVGGRVVTAGIAGLVSILLTAPHWLIFLHTLGESANAYQAPFVQQTGIPEQLAFALGPLAPGPVLAGFHIVGCILLVAALSNPVRLRRYPSVLAALLAALAVLAVAFNVVPESWVIRVPLVANLHHVHDVFVTAALPLLLVVAAAGAATLREAGRVRIAGVTILWIGVSWWLVAQVVVLAPPNGFEPWAAAFALALSAALPASLATSRTIGTRVLPGLSATVAILALVLPGGLHGLSGLAPLDALLVQPRIRVPLDANSPAVDSIHLRAAEPARTLGIDWVLMSGSQAMYELEGINGPDALLLADYDELFKVAGVWRGWGWFTRVPVDDVGRLSPLLDLLNTGFLLARPDEIPPGVVELPPQGADRIKAGIRNTSWPRAFFVDGIETYADASSLMQKIATERRPLAAVQERDRVAIDATAGLVWSGGRAVPAHRYALRVNSTSFSITSPGPGVAVLGETYLPDDFVATLNDQPVGYFRVNHAFKAVRIPSAGEWNVVFRYRPAQWSLSLWLSGSGALIALALALLTRRGPPPA